MSFPGFTSSYTPVKKVVRTLAGTTAFAVWTPSSSTRIVLTDVLVSQAAAGTVVLSFGNLGGTNVVAEMVLGGSQVVQWTPVAPTISPTYDTSLYCVTGANGAFSITVGGFEQE